VAETQRTWRSRKVQKSDTITEITAMDGTSAIEKYLAEISSLYGTERAREHAYRPAFDALIKSIDPLLRAVNEPSRSEYGAPDFIFLRGALIAGYTETKDIDVDLDKTEKTEQLERYLGYPNLILTNYLEFRFFRNGEKYGEPIIVATVAGGKIISHEENFRSLASALLDFLTSEPEQIKSGARLAKIMGAKARRIRDNVRQYLSTPTERNHELERIYETIKKLLVHDLSPEHFADLYAQTLVYGLFAARFHDASKEPFTRQKARDLVPASNPFLRHFFDHIVGPDFDVRLAYIVNELCEIFSHTDVHELMGQYFKKNGDADGPDPVIHFYEDFLKEYDADQRKRMGAFYTPLPVVRFIVRSVDAILERDFELHDGLADTSKISVPHVRQGKKVMVDMHRVQILDPAAGTGTFLNETIRSIAKRFAGQAGRWSAYVNDDLLPRLHGFELMMAPYTIAHLKIAMTLEDSGYKDFSKRLSVYLTNSLEQGELADDTLFGFGLSQSIAEEARAAAVIKRETPIMVVIGNPPYSVSSSNKGEWIQNLVREYKEGLSERNIQPLSDDYIKFIRLAEHFIEQKKSGVVAMITNNSFIDGKIHRQMRKHLLKTFDDIFILDLHGSTRKKEKEDENVFNIQQGVAISIFVRKDIRRKGLGKVHYAEIYGKRDVKFERLNSNTVQTIKWQTLEYTDPYYFFVPKDFQSEDEYIKGFSIDEIFTVSNAGSATGKDSVFVQFTSTELENALRSGEIAFSPEDITDYLYRPFDIRKTLYDKTKIQRLRANVMDHMRKDNLALITCKQQTSFNFQHVFLSQNVTDRCAVSLQTGEVGYIFPLYVYSTDGVRRQNLKKEIVTAIEKIVGAVPPEDIFDYIYAVLHSPSYRAKYKEFLKIDFPRVPYPKDTSQFRALVEKGKELRELHLLESPKLSHLITTYPVAGSNVVEATKYQDGNVYINKDQYFGGVPEIAWNFWVGGYQPAQKWLKDRKGRALSNGDIEQYQKMIVALVETSKVMREIDVIDPL
jgi:type I restriction-modification system DNA methylase subunit